MVDFYSRQRAQRNAHKEQPSGYQECLYFEIVKAGLKVEKQKALPLIYEEVIMDVGYRIDLFIENKFIVEIKSVEALSDIHMAQVITYLRLSKLQTWIIN